MHIITLKRYLALFVTYLKPQWRSALLLALTLLLSIGLQLLNPLILGFFIDTAASRGATPALVGSGILFLGIALASQGTAIVNVYLSTNVAWTATNQLRADLVEHCLALDMDFHKTQTAGALIERIDGDVNMLANFFSQLVIKLLTSLMLLLGILVILFFIDWREGVAMTLFSLVSFVFLLALRRRAIPLWKTSRQLSALFYGFLSERLVGTEDIRANGATAFVLRRFYLLLQEWFPTFRKAETVSGMMGFSSLLLYVCGTALALAIGTALWMQGSMTIGVVYMIFKYADQLSEPIQQIQEQLQSLQQAEACIQRIEELLATQSALRDGERAFQVQGAISVEFEQVTFGYVEQEPVIHALHVRVEAGRVLGILGRTGSGKTTLARLLFRLYDPQKGEVRVNDMPLQELRLRDLRCAIGMVTQDVQLFHASIRDNLTLFNDNIADTRIVRAIEQVGLVDWYQALPDGLDTVLGAAGEGLSAGEKQLLAFARVFLSEPGLIILDEASSRLDPATEKHVEQAVNSLFAGRTALVIAHRLATLQRVDDILILEDGRSVEYGRREMLANDPTSRFAQLLRTGLEEVTA